MGKVHVVQSVSLLWRGLLGFSSSKQNRRSEILSKFLTLRAVLSWDSTLRGVLRVVLGDALKKQIKTNLVIIISL